MKKHRVWPILFLQVFDIGECQHEGQGQVCVRRSEVPVARSNMKEIHEGTKMLCPMLKLSGRT